MSYKIGDIVKGEVVGVQPYGAFINIEDGYTGLLHISEISHNYIKDINLLMCVGDELEIKIVDIDNEKKQAVFSIKAMKKYGRKIHGATRKKYHEKVMETPNGFKSLRLNLPIMIEQYFRRNNHD